MCCKASVLCVFVVSKRLHGCHQTMLLWCQVSVLNMFLTYPLLSLSPTGKVLIIGGSIANFTNVAATFKVKHTDVLIWKNHYKETVSSNNLSQEKSPTQYFVLPDSTREIVLCVCLSELLQLHSFLGQTLNMKMNCSVVTCLQTMCLIFSPKLHFKSVSIVKNML